MTDREMSNEIKVQYQQLENYLESASSSLWDKEFKRRIDNSTSCPFCRGTNITQDIKRVKGEIDANMSSSFHLFGGYSSMSVHGDIDTHEVYVCQDCKNVWKPYKADYRSPKNIFYDELHNFYHGTEERRKVGEIEFDPSNPEETFSTREEKIESRKKDIDKYYFKESCILRNFYPEVIKWYIRNNPNYEYSFYGKILHWPRECFKNYGFKMPPEPVIESAPQNNSLILWVIPFGFAITIVWILYMLGVI